jgi:hypothetical protein
MRTWEFWEEGVLRGVQQAIAQGRSGRNPR